MFGQKEVCFTFLLIILKINQAGVPVVNAQSNQDQRIHCDYGNNSLLHPPSWDDPECVSMIIYLSDESVTGGGTAVVPRRGADDPSYKYPLIAMPGYGGLPFYNDKTSVEAFMKEKHPEYYEFRQDLYTREKRAKFSIGSVLLYRHDVWHRGTPLTPNAVRIVANIGFKKKDCDWVTCWNQGWARKMYYGCVENIIASSSLAQRSVLGFPLPGHKYWNEITIAACDARYSMYEGWDSSVYTKALTK